MTLGARSASLKRMDRDHLAFLAAGLAFGALAGFAVNHAIVTRPDPGTATAEIGGPAGPRGPQAPTEIGGPNVDGGAPMVAEVNRLKRLLQDDATSEAALHRLANLYQDAGMFQQAIGYYERLLAVRPQDPDVLTDLGVCYRGLREFDRALDLFADANRANPRHWQSLFNTAVVAAFDVGQFERAEQALQSIDAIEPPPADLDRSHVVQLRQAVEQARTAAPGGESGRS